MNFHLTDHRGGFAAGYTPVASHEGLTLGVLRLARGAVVEQDVAVETAWLLMQGDVHATVDGREAELRRRSLFDESASCVHAGAGARVRLRATQDCELTVYGAPNARAFASRVFTPEQVPNEHRGKGQVANRSLRFVRTIFDRRNSPAEAELVLGEVVTLPGGWSSYPPHHHPQAEIYHYRFTKSQGYGHAELGDAVVKVRPYDTLLIPAGSDHAQCAAPGYGMYYSWVIRHLPDRPYTVPEFTPEHAWTLEGDATFWWPDDVPR
jgi:5-deoxy-glucuronate isomerase